MGRDCFPFYSTVLLLVHCFLLDDISITVSASSNILTPDHDSLLALKAHITNDPHNFLAKNWLPNTSVCNWTRVICSPTSQRVTSLDLSFMALEGTIPPNLGNLTFLAELNLLNNSFYGYLPTELVELHRLRYLNLGFNNFQGDIPFWFGSLPKLEHLYLNSNHFSGFLPHSLTNISSLKTLLLWDNILHGNIPENIGSLSKLEILSLYGNHKMSGSIPWTIFNISSLKYIDFGFNELSGSLPDDICEHLPNLQELILHHNQLVGQIPSSLSKCGQLLRVSLDNNNFDGSIPPSVGNLTLLTQLYLSGNKLTGTIPQELSSLVALERLWLQKNLLKGSIPRTLVNCSLLWDINLYANNLTGTIPAEIADLRNLALLSMGDNSLTGPIPSTIFNRTSLEVIALYGNMLSGNLPPSFGFGLPHLSSLYLWGNKFDGKIPSSISNASKLAIIELSSNSFSGSIPKSIGRLRNLQRLNLGKNDLTDESSGSELTIFSALVNCKRLEKLVLESNPLNGTLPIMVRNLSTALQYLSMESCNIQGNIPEEISNLSSLITLLLDKNELTGSIPSTIGRLQQLQVLNLADNRLNGSIPDAICHLRNLGELVLSNNRLFGPIPACLSDIDSLRSLHLDSNSFHSAIPTTLWHLTDILYLNLSSNLLTGDLPGGIGSLKVVTQIDLSSNQLSSFIPAEMGSLENLMSLSLAENRFQGPIPDTFGSLISLESLDLSDNNLSGRIPISLQKLLYLKYINVSFNKLEGEIPTGGPFLNFSAKSFQGNEQLCSASLVEFPPCRNSSPRQPKSPIHHRIIYVLLASIIIIPVVFLIIMLRFQKGSMESSDQENPRIPRDWKSISYHELQQATDGFCESNLLGKGGFGSVYKATFSDGTNAAIKVFNLQVEGALNSFDAECEVMRSIRHRNLIKIISTCSKHDFKALILEYMPNGSLEKWLYSHNYCLDILQRLNIMIDVASALEYLHNGFTKAVVHRDLKPSNVLIDKEMVAHVGDFGIAKLLGEGDSVAQTLTFATVGYMAPEYGSEGIVSTRGDVYSFGVLLMETFTRKNPTDEIFCGGMSLKQYVQEAFPDDVDEVLDANFLTGSNLSAERECVSSILGLSLICCADVPQHRRDIAEVLASLNRIRSNFLVSEKLKVSI